MKRLIFICFILLSTSIWSETKPPRLIVQIVVDQLRGDLLYRHQHQFGLDGFNYLIAHGINYEYAFHPQARTTTCPGHATIATGSWPQYHGIVDNHWFDRRENQLTYCVEDKSAPLTIGKHAPSEGRSPKNIQASTIADEIMLSEQGRAFAVSQKDRAAITLAGHTGKALWFDAKNGGIQSSQYFYKALPLWMINWMKHHPINEISWNKSRNDKEYIYKDAHRFKHRFDSFNQEFPHKTGTKNDPLFYKHFIMMPASDAWVEMLAEEIITQEKLGLNPDKHDYLGISFSANDAIGHQFGPDSLEVEDNLLQLDKTIGKLLTFLDKTIGLEHCLIILTADHGVNDPKPWLKQHHMKTHRSINSFDIEQIVENTIKSKWSLDKNLIKNISLPFIYLDHKIIKKYKIPLNQLITDINRQINKTTGVYQAFNMSKINQSNDWVSVKVSHMNHPKLAADIYVVLQPDYDSDNSYDNRVTHGAPWNYDAYVPMIFSNPAFKPKKIHKMVFVTAIAPTIANLLNIKPPSSSVDVPLKEVLNQ